MLLSVSEGHVDTQPDGVTLGLMSRSRVDTPGADDETKW